MGKQPSGNVSKPRCSNVGVSGATLDLLSDFRDRALRFSPLRSRALRSLELLAGEERPELAFDALGLFWVGDPRDLERALAALEPAGEPAAVEA